MDDHHDGAADQAAELARLADGYLVTQLLFVAAELGVADHLADGPRTAADLAARLQADAPTLHRILRGLAAERVLAELPDGRFALTPVAELLRTGTAGSLRGYVLVRGGLYYASMAGLLGSARTGEVPFEVAHGRPFFAHLAAHPEEAAAFQGSMSARSARDAAAVVATYDLGRFGSLVDVGGGHGTLLRAVLGVWPDTSGLLFDRPEVVAATDLPAVGGDFFVEVPAGADCYLLSRVIHDWDDGEAVAILRTCRRAMLPTSTLLLVEALLPERAIDSPPAIRMDLHMLALVTGRERTESEYAQLLRAADLALTTTTTADARTGLHVLAAVPA